MTQLAKKWKICFCEMACSNVYMKLQLYDCDYYQETDLINNDPSKFTQGGGIPVNRTFEIKNLQNPENAGIIDSEDFTDDQLVLSVDEQNPLEIVYSYESEVSIEALKCAFKICENLHLPNSLKVSYSLDDGLSWIEFQNVPLQGRLSELETLEPGIFVVFDIINSIPEQEWGWSMIDTFTL